MATRKVYNLYLMVLTYMLVVLCHLQSVKALGESSPLDEKTVTTYSIYVDEKSGNERQITWVYTKNSWLHLYVRMCGEFCNGSQNIFIGKSSPEAPFCSEVCYNCDCEVDCGMYGTCCPQLDPSTPLGLDDTKKSSDRRIYFIGNLSSLMFEDKNGFLKYVNSNPGRKVDENLHGHFRCIPVVVESYDAVHVFAVGYCPRTEVNQTLRGLCETDNPDPVTVEAVLPVSDTRNGIVYKNVYCLKCWQENRPDTKLTSHDDGLDDDKDDDDDDDTFPSLGNRYSKWKMTIDCVVYQTLYRITDLNIFLSHVLKSHTSSNPYCTLAYTLDDAFSNNATMEPKYCYRHPKQSSSPKCNGFTAKDETVSTLCASITSPAYSVSGGHNVFCSLCNDDFPSCSADVHREEMTITTPINFLLGYEPMDAAETTRIYETYSCSQPLQWMHKKEGCVLPSCAEGKVLDETIGQCRTAISVIENLGYKLSMVLTPDQNIPTQYSYRILDEVDELYMKLMESAFLAVYLVVFGLEQTEEYDVIKHIKIQGHFVAKKGLKRDDFETRFMNYKFKILLNNLDQNSTVTLVPGGMGVHHVGMMGIREYTQGNPEDQYHWPAPLTGMAGVMADQPIESEIRTPPPTAARDSPKPITQKTELYAEVGNPKPIGPIWKKKSEFIDMTPTLLCPFVVFDVKEVSRFNDTKLLITFFYNDQEKSIDTTLYDRNLTLDSDGRKIKICIELFREEFQKITISETIKNYTDTEITWMSSVKRHLTICCLILSVICLLITSVTYCVFSQLRTLPGLNTLSLCLTLATAQLTLIIVVEVVGYVDGYICIVLGIALHYTWLCSFCWMGVSCVHMYLVFKGSNTRQVTNRSPTERHTQYRILAFGTSAVIVSVHICVCEIASEGETTGYSDQLCFFDTHWSILTVMISFVAPLAILLVVNVILFGIAVREMVLVRRLQAVRRVKSRDELLTYVKLSTMTGIQWLVSLVAIRLNSDIIDICVAILVGLQGVFIFVSFTLNKNTRNLYSNLCSRNAADTSSGSDSDRKSSTSNTHALVTQATDV